MPIGLGWLAMRLFEGDTGFLCAELVYRRLRCLKNGWSQRAMKEGMGKVFVQAALWMKP